MTPDQLVEAERLCAAMDRGPMARMNWQDYARTFLPQLLAAYRALEAENVRLNKMRTHCTNCGADYMATGIEAGCPCHLRAAAKALVDKLAECQPAIDGAFVMAQVHGSRYTGPTYGVELAALAALVEDK